MLVQKKLGQLRRKVALKENEEKSHRADAFKPATKVFSYDQFHFITPTGLREKIALPTNGYAIVANSDEELPPSMNKL